MKKLALLLVAALYCVPSGLAQNHGEAGVFAEYLRLQKTDTNHVGAGARLSINVHTNIQLEAELAYDFQRGFAERFNNGVPTQFSLARSNVRILTGLFGPKIQTGGGSVRLFATVKGGFMEFGFNKSSSIGPGFTSAINDLRRDNLLPAVYPGGGVEFFLGPVGIRADAGDQIYFQHGVNNNFRFSAGPQLRF